MKLMERARKSVNDNKEAIEHYKQISFKHQLKIMELSKRILSMEKILDLGGGEFGSPK
eukprot:gnl/Chilomastix_caulleri/2327.p3 GENE.gnl/Chilomastix_caulleri/2327~~gnl/Chilomastix_caulleri/2327.p3  ORF type:complete len:58 (+),score=17.37 gnl/Chilomastix_caulleri/2327:755-928(+)